MAAFPCGWHKAHARVVETPSLKVWVPGTLQTSLIGRSPRTPVEPPVLPPRHVFFFTQLSQTEHSRSKLLSCRTAQRLDDERLGSYCGVPGRTLRSW